MSPFQHGEVYVTEDGAETDLDLGPLRALHRRASSPRTATTRPGKIYSSVIAKERRGDYLGQDGPGHPARHRRDQGGDPPRRRRRRRPDLRAGRHGRRHRGPALPRGDPPVRARRGPEERDGLPPHATSRTCAHSGELKTKPSQHSRRAAARDRHPARRPDLPHRAPAARRGARPSSRSSATCRPRPSIEEQDVATSIYEVPQMLAEQRLDKLILERLGLPDTRARPRRATTSCSSASATRAARSRSRSSASTSSSTTPTRASTRRSPTAASPPRPRCASAASSPRTSRPSASTRSSAASTASSCPAASASAASRARSRRSAGRARTACPYLGLCLGHAVRRDRVRAQRRRASQGAHSTEFDAGHAAPGDRPDARPAGPRARAARCGSARTAARCAPARAPAPPTATRSSRSATATATSSTTRTASSSRPRASFVGGVNPERDLVEIVELHDHPYFVAVQFHPEFKSKPTRPHPLFRELVAAALRHKEQTVPPVAEESVGRDAATGSAS